MQTVPQGARSQQRGNIFLICKKNVMRHSLLTVRKVLDSWSRLTISRENSADGPDARNILNNERAANSFSDEFKFDLCIDFSFEGLIH